MQQAMVIALILVVLTGPARAASFDCGKARAADEKAICADRSLNDADVRMATMLPIAEGLIAMGARGDMQDDQVVWLKARHGCGGDRACLAASYRARIAVIQRTLDAIKSRGPF